jgi:hypothetical protein
MKTLSFVTGAVSISAFSMGFLFKIMHWPLANILLVIGISLFSLVFIPSYFRYRYTKV